jgi:hypothetical protein
MSHGELNTTRFTIVFDMWNHDLQKKLKNSVRLLLMYIGNSNINNNIQYGRRNSGAWE